MENSKFDAMKSRNDKGEPLEDVIMVQVAFREHEFKAALVHLGWTPPPTEPVEKIIIQGDDVATLRCGKCKKDVPELEITGGAPPHFGVCDKCVFEEVDKRKDARRAEKVSKFVDLMEKGHFDPPPMAKEETSDSDSRRAHMAMRLRDQGFTVEQVLELLAKPSPVDKT